MFRGLRNTEISDDERSEASSDEEVAAKIEAKSTPKSNTPIVEEGEVEDIASSKDEEEEEEKLMVESDEDEAIGEDELVLPGKDLMNGSLMYFADMSWRKSLAISLMRRLVIP